MVSEEPTRSIIKRLTEAGRPDRRQGQSHQVGAPERRIGGRPDRTPHDLPGRRPPGQQGPQQSKGE